MKVALVILHANPARGGAERYTIDLAAALTGRGHHVKLLASSFANDVPDGRRVTIRASGLTRAAQYASFLTSLARHLDDSRYDVVHAMLPVTECDLYHPHAGVAAAAVKVGDRLRNPRRDSMARVEAALLTGSQPPVVLCLSDYVKAAVRGRYPDLAEDRLATLFNAVDLERFKPAAPPREFDSSVVTGLMIANDFERKGLAETIRALAMVRDTRLALDVVGKQDTSRYDALARELEVHDAIVFHGPTPDPRPHYAAADFFVLPTRHDPCSLVVLEALASGLPVISTRANGATEIMTDGVHGYVLDNPRDVDALAGAMRNMLDPTRRAAMRQACVDLRPRLSYEHHLDALLRIYESCVARKNVRKHAAKGEITP